MSNNRMTKSAFEPKKTHKETVKKLKPTYLPFIMLLNKGDLARFMNTSYSIFDAFY